MNKRIKRILSAILIMALILGDCSGIFVNISHATEQTNVQSENQVQEENLNSPKLNLSINLDSFLNLVNFEKRILKLKLKVDYENVTEIEESYTEIALPKLAEEIPVNVKINEIYGEKRLAKTLSRR